MHFVHGNKPFKFSFIFHILRLKKHHSTFVIVKMSSISGLHRNALKLLKSKTIKRIHLFGVEVMIYEFPFKINKALKA